MNRSNHCEKRHHFSTSEDGLDSRRENQTSLWEGLAAALEEAEGRNAYMAHLAEVRQEDAVEQSPIDDPSRDPEQPVPGTELPEAEEMEQEALDQFVLPGMTDMEKQRKRECGCRFRARDDVLFGCFTTRLVTHQSGDAQSMRRTA